jgi:hypothetical protein
MLIFELIWCKLRFAFFEKINPYISKLKILISNNGSEFFKNPITYFPQG